MDTPSLCGRVRERRGWDLEVRFTEHHLSSSACQKCVAKYLELTQRPALYERLYAVLIGLADASLDSQPEFVRYFSESDQPTLEWRFQGRFGFGGKFWRRPTGHEVTCYVEDLNDERSKLLLIVNQRLEAVTAEFKPTLAPRAE